MGAHIPIPGINSEALMDAFRAMQSQNTLLGLFNMFAGGAFQTATLFALLISPILSEIFILFPRFSNRAWSIKSILALKSIRLF